MTGTALRQVTVGPSLAHVATAGGSVWVTRPGAGLVARIDPASGNVAQTLPIGHGAYALAEGGGILWVTTVDPIAVRDFTPT